MRTTLKLCAAAALLALPVSVRAAPMVIVEPAVTNAMLGDRIAVNVFIDTDGLTFEEYALSIGFRTRGTNGADVTNVARTINDLGFIADLSGPPVIDDPAGDVRNLNASSFTLSLGPGVYLVETLEFTIDLASGIIDVTPFLGDGESLGLDDGVCPFDGVGRPPCEVGFVGAVVNVTLPEPGLALLVAGAGLGLRAARRRR